MKLRFFNLRNDSIRKTPKRNVLAVLPALLLILSLGNTSSVWAETTYRVKSSDNLESIVTRHYLNSGLSKYQLMAAIFARNSRAFKDGNVNILMRGRRLVLPDVQDLEIVSLEQSKLILGRDSGFARQGITGGVPEVEFQMSDNDLKELNAQHLAQQQQLIKLEREREQLKSQLEKLAAEKKQSDKKLEALELNLLNRQQNASSGSTNAKTSVNLSSRVSEINDEISTDKNKRLLEDQVKHRTQKLQDSNRALQKQLSRSHSELAENVRENISLERQLGELKGTVVLEENIKIIEQEIGQTTEIDNQDAVQDSNNNNKTGLNNTELKHTSESHAAKSDLDNKEDNSNESETSPIDSVNNGLVSRLLWLIPLIAVLTGLWLLLRSVLTKKSPVNEVEEFVTPITPQFEDSEDIDPDYEEVSLETSIKLDVARAYIEAEDNESAVEMLNEVMQEGNDAQQQEAQEILDSLAS